MKDVVAMNGHVFFTEVKETRDIEGFELITEFDQDHRYSKGVCYSADESVPLEEGDIFLYDVKQAWDVYVNKTMYKAVHASRILGKLNESTEQ